jgi:hypothetical protein
MTYKHRKGQRSMASARITNKVMGGPENMASDSEPEIFFGVVPLKGPPKLQKIDIIAVGNDNKIFIHFR